MHDILITRDRANLGSNMAVKFIKKAIIKTLEVEGVAVPCEVNVLLTDDAGIHEINLEFREIDRPTDVLSFPMNELIAGEFDSEACEENMDTGKKMLGDMVLSLERAREQAIEYGHSEGREICYLTIHSILHLLGYDHMDEGEEKRLMRSREEIVCERLGI